MVWGLFLSVGLVWFFFNLATVQRIWTGESAGEQKEKQKTNWSIPQEDTRQR